MTYLFEENRIAFEMEKMASLQNAGLLLQKILFHYFNRNKYEKE